MGRYYFEASVYVRGMPFEVIADSAEEAEIAVYYALPHMIDDEIEVEQVDPRDYHECDFMKIRRLSDGEGGYREVHSWDPEYERPYDRRLDPAWCENHPEDF